MRAPAVSSISKIVAAAFAALLIFALVPTDAFAEGEGASESGVEAVASGLSDQSNDSADSVILSEDNEAASPSVALSGASGGGEVEGSNTKPLTLASGVVGKPSNFINSDVVFDGEPVIGSFTVDGLTFAVIDESTVELVGVSEAAAEAGMLTLPESVAYEGTTYALASIAPYAFYLSGVTDVTLPASVSDVDDRAFRSSDVASVTVAEGNPTYSSFDGALYDAEQLSLLLIPEGKQGTVRIPKTAEVVSPSVFSHCPLVDAISVDAGSAAFASENGLLYTSDLTTLLRVPAGATEITIREGCATIAAGALEACAKLTTINAPATVTSISPDVFHAIPTVSLLAASLTGTDESGASGESSSQLTALMALSITDDGLAEVEPASIALLLPSNAMVSAWRVAGFLPDSGDIAVADMESPTASLNASSLYEAGITTVSPNGGQMWQWLNGDFNQEAVENDLTSETWRSFYVSGSYLHQNVSTDSWSWTAYYEGIYCTGWSRSSGNGAGGTKLPQGYTLTATEGTIYACWPSNIAVTLDKNTTDSGSTSGTARISCTVAQAMPAITLPTRPGYKFDGYFSASSGGVRYYNADGSSARKWNKDQATTLYAHWTKKASHAVTLNKNNGMGGTSTVYYWPDRGYTTSSTSTTVIASGSVLVSSLPTRAGYTFAGYYSAASGGTQYVDSSGKRTTSAPALTAAATWYAHWTKKASFAVTLNKNNGFGGTSTVYYWPGRGYTTSSTSTTVIASGSVLVSSLPTRAGYTFAGYYSAASGGTQYVDSSGKRTTSAPALTAAATWHAHWTKKTSHAVTLDKNNGTGGTSTVYYWPDKGYTTSSTSTTVIASGSVLVSSLPTRAGYTFVGYYSTASGGMQYVDSSGKRTTSAPALTTAATWHAQWTANTITLTWNSQGGSAVGSTSKVYASGVKVPMPASNPTKAGYSFKGWFTATSGGTQVTSNTALPTSNATYYAQWNANTITLTWNSQGGSAVSNTSATYSPTAKVPMPATTSRSGYTFAGWWTSATGGTQVTASTALPTSNKTYYAHWSLNPYAITYDLAGGTVSGNPTTYDVTTTTFTLKNPTRTGYAFAGWSGTGLTGSANKTVTIAKGSTGNRAYTANWTANSYTVEYWDKAGTTKLSSDTGFRYDTARALAGKPSSGLSTGYTALGWARSAGQSSAAYGFGSSQSNLATSGTKKLYLAEKANPYTIAFDTQCDLDVADVSATYDQDVTLPAPPERKGYIFNGWNTEADGSGELYEAGVALEKPNLAESGTVTLYAQWRAAISADAPVDATVRVDLLGIEDQAMEPGKEGYIESRSGAPLKVESVAFTREAGAEQLFGSSFGQVSLQALAGDDASWATGTPAFSFALDAAGADAVEDDEARLAPFAMAGYEARIPISYRFDIPSDVLAAIDPARFEQVTTSVCSVVYTVALQNPPQGPSA